MSEEKVLVEVSARHIHLSDADVEALFGPGYKLTVKKELSQPGQFASNEKVTIKGERGEMKKGVIAAKRHVHMTPADAVKFGVTNGQIVSVKIDTDGRSLTFGDTVVRVSDKYALAMHIDTDEANAAAISGSAMGEIIK